MRELAAGGTKGLFYNSKLELNQGAYLTEAKPSLLSVLNEAYQALSGAALPYLEADEDLSPGAVSPRQTYDIDTALEAQPWPVIADRLLRLVEEQNNVAIEGNHLAAVTAGEVAGVNNPN